MNNNKISVDDMVKVINAIDFKNKSINHSVKKSFTFSNPYYFVDVNYKRNEIYVMFFDGRVMTSKDKSIDEIISKIKEYNNRG